MNKFIKFVKEHSQKFDESSIFTVNALAGELGELANVVKKEKYAEFFKDYPRINKNKPSFQEQKVDEAGDVLFYFIQFLNRNNIKIEEVIEYHKNKINKYSEELGRNFLK